MAKNKVLTKTRGANNEGGIFTMGAQIFKTCVTTYTYDYIFNKIKWFKVVLNILTTGDFMKKNARKGIWTFITFQRIEKFY